MQTPSMLCWHMQVNIWARGWSWPQDFSRLTAQSHLTWLLPELAFQRWNTFYNTVSINPEECRSVCFQATTVGGREDPNKVAVKRCGWVSGLGNFGQNRGRTRCVTGGREWHSEQVTCAGYYLRVSRHALTFSLTPPNQISPTQKLWWRKGEGSAIRNLHSWNLKSWCNHIVYKCKMDFFALFYQCACVS